MKLNCQLIGLYVPGGRLPFQSLNYSIYTNGSSQQRFSDFCNRLMMGAIHSQVAVTHNASKHRATLHLNCMHHIVFEVHLPVIDSPGSLLRDVHQQAPPQRHVQNLLPAANRQQRLALAQHLINEQQFE